MYLDNWKEYATSKEGMTMDERNKLMLSAQTLEGLKITGKISHCILN